MSVPNNPRLQCWGQAKTFSIQDLANLMGNAVDYDPAAVQADDQLRLFGSSDVVTVGDLMDLANTGTSANLSTADSFHAAGQAAAVTVLEVLQFLAYSFASPNDNTN